MQPLGPGQPGDQPQGAHDGEGHEHVGPLDQPRRPVGPGEQVVEPPGLAQVAHQQRPGGGQRQAGHHGRGHPHRGPGVDVAEHHQQRGHPHHPGGHRLGDQIPRHLPLPRHRVGGGVGGAGRHPGLVGGSPAGPDRGGGMVVAGVGPDHAVVGDGGGGRVEQGLIDALVVHLGPGVLLGGAHRQPLGGGPADLGLGVVEVADPDGLGGAHDLARRLQAHLDPVVAHVALVGGAGVGVYVQGVVGAGVHARLAADAVAVVEVHHPVGGPVQRRGGADGHAGGVVALVAAHHGELAGDVREGPGLDVLHPGAVDAQGHVVLALAGHGAGVAADAASAVEQEPQPRHCGVSLRLRIAAAAARRPNAPVDAAAVGEPTATIAVAATLCGRRATSGGNGAEGEGHVQRPLGLLCLPRPVRLNRFVSSGFEAFDGQAFEPIEVSVLG